jgi:hypothetical protein
MASRFYAGQAQGSTVQARMALIVMAEKHLARPSRLT